MQIYDEKPRISSVIIRHFIFLGRMYRIMEYFLAKNNVYVDSHVLELSTTYQVKREVVAIFIGLGFWCMFFDHRQEMLVSPLTCPAKTIYITTYGET